MDEKNAAVAATVLNEFNTRKEYPKKEDVVAILLSGSRLRSLNLDENADWDLYVLVNDSKENMLKNTTYSAQMKISDNIDAKVMDFRQLYNILIKSNPNIIEVFAFPESLILLNPNLSTANIVMELQSLGTDIFNINPERYVKSLGGNLRGIAREVQKGNYKRLPLIFNMVYEFQDVAQKNQLKLDQSQSFTMQLKSTLEDDEFGTLEQSKAMDYINLCEEIFQKNKDQFLKVMSNPYSIDNLFIKNLFDHNQK